MSSAFGVTGAELTAAADVFAGDVDTVAGGARPLAACAVHGGTAGEPFQTEGERYVELMATLARRIEACAASAGAIGTGLRSASQGYGAVDAEQAAAFTELDGSSP